MDRTLAFLAHQPTDLLIDLFGYPVYLTDGEPLGDGWWYVRTDEPKRTSTTDRPNRAGAGQLGLIRTRRRG
jgi:hypothetical protein